MSDYIPTTEEIRAEFFDAFENNSLPLEFSSAFVLDKFDRWLNQVKAQAWEEGFNAGEKDVWMHEEKQDWGSADTKCIPNPYRKGENK